MQVSQLSSAVILSLALSYPGWSLAASHTPRTCGASYPVILEQNAISPGGIGGTGHESVVSPGGIGGTGHEPTIPSGGIGGTGHESSIVVSAAAQETAISSGGTGHETVIPPGGAGGSGHETAIPAGGMGGTGHEAVIPPGGIGGTGIVAAGSFVNIHGIVMVEDIRQQKIQLSTGDEICVGDRIATTHDAKAKIVFSDGATLYVLKNSEVSVIDYMYSTEQPKLSRSTIKLAKGDIRSVSGEISKINPQHYSFSTPVSSIQVIGTDFLITHLTEQEGALDAGTYAKVISGEIKVQSSSTSTRLRAGESSHVMLNGTQSVTSSGGGTCVAP